MGGIRIIPPAVPGIHLSGFSFFSVSNLDIIKNVLLNQNRNIGNTFISALGLVCDMLLNLL